MLETHDVRVHEDEHGVPDRTTPQGTQEHGVEHGHEGTDANVRTIIWWFVALAVVAGIIHVVLWGAVVLWEGFDVDVLQRQAPTEVLRARPVPPEPRLLPNPVDFPEVPTRPLPGPAEVRFLEEHEETRRLAEIGLVDPETGLYQVPDVLVEQVLKPAPPDPPGRSDIGIGPQDPWPREDLLRQLMPSEPSGGTALENRLE